VITGRIWSLFATITSRRNATDTHKLPERKLVEETKDLATGLAATSLVVVHDTSGGGEDDVTELTSREDVGDPLLDIIEGNIEAGGDNTALVDATVEVDNDLAGALVIDDLELVDVAVLLHNLKELDNDLGRRADNNLALTTALGVGDVDEGVVENRNQDH
jgi:hypothetical protein